MPTVALAGYAAFVLVTLVGRAVLARARTGDWAIRLGFARSARERVAHALFVGGGVGLALGPALALAGIGARPVAWAEPIAGSVLAMLGAAGTLWSQLVMGSSWRIGVDPGERTVLVARGPFRWVRNPIFASMLLAGAGLVALAPTVVGAVALVALAVGLELQVRLVEEPYLAEAHGAAYRDYAARTGRFLPGLGRLASR